MSLFKSIATFGSFTFLSRITGFLRDMVLAKYLGAGLISDAFFVSFKLPNLFRSLFAEGAFASAFVPIVSQKLCDGKEEARKFSSAAISVLAFFITIFVIVIEIIMPAIVTILAPGFASNPEQLALATTLSRITFPFLLFISVVSFQSGILSSLGKFAAPASAPIILNLLMVASVFIFVPFAPSTAHGIAFGITFAGFIEVLWLRYFLRKEKMFINIQFNMPKLLKDKDIKTLFKRMAPGILGSGIYQINVMVSTIIASLVAPGAISWLYYADRIQQLPIGVVGAAISVALLPILSTHIKNNDDAQTRHAQSKAFEYGAMLAIPAMIAIIILALPITNILFQHGRFGAFETEMTYKAIIAYIIGLPFYVCVKAMAPNLFARGDTKTPVKYGLVSFIVNIAASMALAFPFGHIGIAAGSAVSSIVSFFLYYFGLKKRGFWNIEHSLVKQIIKITFCAIIMGIVLKTSDYGLRLYFGNWLDFHFFIKLSLFLGLCLFGLATFGLLAKITGVINIADIKKALSKNAKAKKDKKVSAKSA
ncbi:MAG: murein biosynthesis integral membrane protein MurJ [Lactobacillus sp.]|jgi:putative peptidoglycan lipid II flippase|nr:murein biosynthesis integral membrane protein MurJ [Lactobacillus sp.]